MEYSPTEQSPQVDPDISVYGILVNQMNQEIVNSRVYQNFSAICDLNGFIGARKYFKSQSNDELIHHAKIYDYICSRGWIPTLQPLPEEEFNTEWSHLEMFAQAVQLERDNLKLISDIQKKSLASSDFETFNFIQWFVVNQTSEIDEMTKWKQKFMIASESPAAILNLDEQLGEF